jgi:enterochelin esterase-like enzyme
VTVARSAAVGLLRTLAVLAAFLAGWGWVEFLHGVRLPGPQAVDAAPLYENASRDVMPALLVAGVWAGVAVVADRLAGRRLPWRATAALGLLVLMVAVQAVQLEIVRQSVFGFDVSAAVRTGAVWIAAAAFTAPLAASGIVVLARRTGGLMRRVRWGAVAVLAGVAGVVAHARGGHGRHPAAPAATAVRPDPPVTTAPPVASAAERPAASRLEVLDVESRALGRSEPVRVYLPPGYDATSRYPMLVLLHGIPGDVADFANRTRAIADRLIESGRIRPIVIAFPAGSGSPSDDATEWADGPGTGDDWFSFGTSEAPSAVAARYAILPGAEARGIGGFSAGADAATNAMLEHPEDWALLLAWSGSYNQTPSTVGNERPLIKRFSALLNVSSDAPSLAALHRPVSMRVGLSDSFLTEARQMVAALTRAGVDVTYNESQGGHDWSVWTAAIDHDLVFADGRLAH